MSMIQLDNGCLMPKVGFGTHGLDESNIDRLVSSALETGYRKFDCAWIYGNEKNIGNCLQKSGIPREELWLTSKLHIKDLIWGSYSRGLYFRRKKIETAFEQTCERLQTDYLDCYMLHWPWKDFLNMWEDLIDLYEEGRIKSIGISGGLPYHFKEIEKRFNIIPMVNQIEFHPYNCDLNIINYCRKRNCAIEVYPSFAGGRNHQMDAKQMVSEPMIKKIAHNHGVSVYHLIYKWALQSGTSIITRSTDELHIRENFKVNDFILTSEEMQQINNLNKCMYFWEDPYLTIPKK